MLYVVLFLAGASLSASMLLILYDRRVNLLRKEKRRLERWNERLKSDASSLTQGTNELRTKEGQLSQAITEYEARRVRYDDLFKENDALKQDLFNFSVESKKVERDHAAMIARQDEIDKRATELAERYLSENVSWVAAKLNPSNFATCKKRLLKVVQRCRDIGFGIPELEEVELVQELRKNFEEAVRAEFHRQEQSRIKAQIREEEKLAREIERQIQDAQREEAAIQAALERAIKDTKDEHSAEVERLKAKLKEAQEKGERAKSRAQMTKSGHVYVISNIGSFGTDVYKIGMTRRLEPMDRVRELSAASVPFPFDVHMMISCNDAPSLENALHRELHKKRLNRTNPRKEFFRIDFEGIKKIVEAHHGEKVDYVADPAALQYRESLEMTEEDQEFVEETVRSVMDEGDGFIDDE